VAEKEYELGGIGQYQRGPRVPKTRETRGQVSVRLPADLIEFGETEALRQAARPPYPYVTFSTVVRQAMEHFRATKASEPIVRKLPCNHVQLGNSAGCMTCNLRWEVDDPLGQPECPYKKDVRT
jgi:hypothetical protein